MSPSLPPLSRSAHDRAGQHREDDAWLASAWADAGILLVSPSGRTPVTGGASIVGLHLIDAAEADALAADSGPRLLLGEHEGRAYFALPVAGEPSAPTDGTWSWSGLREVGVELDDLEAGLLTAAVALSQWHRTHDHCPRCGAVTEVVSAGWSRVCPVDGSAHFPRTDPAVIMLVHDGGDRCVLGRQATWPEGRFSILAGFVEAGESAEAAVAREVGEEVGLVVEDIRYVASQPWPFPASLMLGYIARVVGDQELVLHDGELAEAHWFTREQMRGAARWDGRLDLEIPPPPPGSPLAALPGGISIARQLIDIWLDG